MPIVTSLGRWLLALSLSFNVAFLALSQPVSSAPAIQNSSDQEALRALVEKYFALYAAKDLDGLMGLWSEKSPDHSSLKQNLERQFATESYSLSLPTISRVKAEEDKVSLRATARLTVIGLKSNQKRELQLARNFALVWEEKKWKVWRCAPAEEDLAEALVKVESEAERAKLLAEEKELVTAELVRAMIGQGYRLYLQSGFDQSIAIYRLSQSIAEQIGDKAGIARALNDIASIYNIQGNNAQALEYLQRSLAMSEAGGDNVGISRALITIGEIQFQQGDFARALEHFRKSLEMSESPGDKTAIANSLGNLGALYFDQAEYAQALTYYQKSLVMWESTRNKKGIADSLCKIGDVYEKQGRHSQALDFSERATVLARQISAADTLRRALFNSGVVYRALNQFAKARQAFGEAIATIEALRAQIAGGEQEQQRYFESKVSPYHAMVDLLIAEDHPAEALTFAERAKARVLLDVLQSGRVNAAKAMTGEEQEQERK